MNPNPEQLESESEQLAHMTKEEAARIQSAEAKAGHPTGKNSVAAKAQSAAAHNEKAEMCPKPEAQFPSETKIDELGKQRRGLSYFLRHVLKFKK